MTITVDLTIYSLDLVLRTCHAFTNRCYVFPRSAENGQAVIELAPRDERDSLRDLAGELSNALLESRLREVVAAETRSIRELLVAQAFCEAGLLDRRHIEGDENDDPRGIAG